MSYGFALTVAGLALLLCACASKTNIQSNTVVMNDGFLSSQIKIMLLEDPRINAYDIQVSAMNGVVTLAGETENVWQRRLAQYMALEVDGVTRVENQLSTRRKMQAPVMDSSPDNLTTDPVSTTQ